MRSRIVLFTAVGLLVTWGSYASDYVQIVTHSAGVAASLWQSDLTVRADGGVPAQVVVDLLGKGLDNSTPLATTTVNVAAGDSVTLADIVYATFGLSQVTGALRLTTISGVPSFESRTRNVGLWTYAYDVPVDSASEVIPVGSVGRIIHLTGTVDQRSNLGYVNVTGSPITVDVSLYRADATLYDSFSVSLSPYEMNQTFNIFPSNDVADGYAVLSTATSGGAFIAHGMVVDNNSGEWIMIPAAVEGTFPVKGVGPVVYYIPLVQRTLDGQTATARSELEVSTGPNEGVYALFDLLASDQDNSSPVTANLSMVADLSVRVPDLLDAYAAAGTGAMRVTVTSGWLLGANTIAYDDSTGSTWGRHIPLIPAADALGGTGLSAMVLGLQHDGDTHSDIGVLNLEATNSTFYLTLVDGDGNAIGHSQATLLPFEHHEFPSVFASYGTVTDGSVLVVSNGTFLCYGSVVETSSGDSGYETATASPLRFLDGFEDATTDGWSSVSP